MLELLFRAAVAAAHPSHCLPPALPEPPPRGRLVILAAGKGAGSLTEVAEQHYLETLPPDRLDGIAVTRHGYGRPTRRIAVVEAGHPVPDAAGLAGAERTLALADAAGGDDLVLVLLSGGASANWIAPAAGLTLAEKQATTRALLRSGANIGEINCVRKHLSRIKGGRLAKRAYPAQPRHARDLRRARRRPRGDRLGADGAGSDHACRRPRAGRQIPARTAGGRGAGARRSRRTNRQSPASRYLPITAIGFWPGRRMRSRPPRLAPARPATTPWCLATGCRVKRARLRQSMRGWRGTTPRRGGMAILSGGELTVTLRGGGRGGPNQEYALALAYHLGGAKGIAALAADTDGTDGGRGLPDDPAGAFIDDTTLARAQAAGLDPAAFLADNNSTGFFNGIGDLFIPGPTFTNVTDFRAILVDRPRI